ncbi:MAG: class I SAM-dependent methyltransferase [Nitrospirae bacterium]|nr:class I SAM-dependent methyltransferase [Nitrospirota bacterium]
MNDEDKTLWDFHETENRQSFALARPRLNYITKRISKIKKAGKVLDIGIGDGYLLEALSKRYNVYGLDISSVNIEKTQEDFEARKINAHLTAGSIQNAPYADNTFDIVVASEVLEHLERKDAENAIKEVGRILKKGGFFVGTVPADENLKDNTCFCPNCGLSYHRWGHKQSLNKDAITTMFTDGGFQSRNLKRVTFFWSTMDRATHLNKIKFAIGKLLFGLLRRIFAPQWWIYFEMTKI